MSNVCYGVAVKNGLGLPVWSRGAATSNSLCSSNFGNGAGGDISYVGPCDADEPGHTVFLTVETLYDTFANPLVEGTDWINPCPVGDPCDLSVTCNENADTPVTFNLTIVRRAFQGFFDLAVNFDSIFCSAKLDCTYDEAGLEPIELLHNEEGDRAQTLVAAVACSAGPGVDTELYLNDIRFECDESEALDVMLQAEIPTACDTTTGGTELLMTAAAALSADDLALRTLEGAGFCYERASGSPDPWERHPMPTTIGPDNFDVAIGLHTLGPNASGSPLSDVNILGVVANIEDIGLVPWPPVGDDSPVEPQEFFGVVQPAVFYWDGSAFKIRSLLPLPAAPTSAEGLLPLHVLRQSPTVAQIIYADNVPDQEFGAQHWVQRFALDTMLTSGLPRRFLPPADPELERCELSNPNPTGHLAMFRCEFADYSKRRYLVDLTSPAPAMVLFDGSDAPTIPDYTVVLDPYSPVVLAGEYAYAVHKYNWSGGEGPPGDGRVRVVRYEFSGASLDSEVVLIRTPPAPGTSLSYDTELVDIFLYPSESIYEFPDAGTRQGAPLVLVQGSTLVDTVRTPFSRYGLFGVESGDAVLRLFDFPPDRDPYQTDVDFAFTVNTGTSPSLTPKTYVIHPLDQAYTPAPGQLALGLLEESPYPSMTTPTSSGVFVFPSPFTDLPAAPNDPPVPGDQRQVLGYWNLRTVLPAGDSADGNIVDVLLEAEVRSEEYIEFFGPPGFWNAFDYRHFHILYRLDFGSGEPVLVATTTILASGTLDEDDSDLLLGPATIVDDNEYSINQLGNGCASFVGGEMGLFDNGGTEISVAQAITALSPLQIDPTSEMPLGPDYVATDTAPLTAPGAVMTELFPGVSFDETEPAGAAGGRVQVLAGADQEGNLWGPGDPREGPAFQVGHYFGEESLPCGAQSCGKVYSNIAIGFDPNATNCRLRYEVTAARPGVFTAGASPAMTTYPVLVMDALITSDGSDPDDNLLCHQNPMDEPGSGVNTVFTPNYLPAGLQFCWGFDGATYTPYCSEDPDHDYSQFMLDLSGKLYGPIDGGKCTEPPCFPVGDGGKAPESGD